MAEGSDGCDLAATTGNRRVGDATVCNCNPCATDKSDILSGDDTFALRRGRTPHPGPSLRPTRARTPSPLAESDGARGEGRGEGLVRLTSPVVQTSRPRSHG